METLVATVLIVVVFMVASMVLNTLFASSISNNDNQIKQELLQLEYRHQHGQLNLPYTEELESWHINIVAVNFKNEAYTQFSAKHDVTGKEIAYKILNE